MVLNERYIKIEDYQHPLEERTFNALQKNFFAVETVIEYYSNIVVPQRRVDLLGKTIKVNRTQFGKIYLMLKEICVLLNVPLPDVFIYEDFYYGARIGGLDEPWIEISAKTVSDFKDEELTFLLATQVARIHAGHLKTLALIEQYRNIEHSSLGTILGSFTLGISNIISEGFLLATNKWMRVSTYSMDACGFLIVKNIRPIVNEFIKEVLNSKQLLEHVNVKDFIKQSMLIDNYHDTFSSYKKLQQEVPFTSYRIKELLRYISSDRAKKYF